jgi:mannitol-1-/sugar-/sorbitol-6-phosphatase
MRYRITELEGRRKSVRVRAAVFDMDGTLLSSDAVIARVWGKWARKHGLDTEKLLAAGRGRRIADNVLQFSPAGVDIQAETKLLEQGERDDVEGIVPLPGILDFLGKLSPDRWAIVTSADRALATVRLTAAGIPLPSILICAEDVRNGKPNPEGYLEAMRRLGVQPGQTVVFEDSEAGLAAARTSGAHVIAIAAPADGAHPGHLTSLPDYSTLSLHIENDEMNLVF